MVESSDIASRIWLIAGPTASGKSAHALDLAERIGGEIVNADSMQIYAGLRILTAGPSPEDIARAPHHLFQVVDPAIGWSVGRWLEAATQALSEIQARGKPAIVVGGTGLYFRALTHGLADVPPVPETQREISSLLYAARGETEFREILKPLDPEAEARIESGDRQRLVRAHAVAIATGKSLTAWQTDTKPALAPGSWKGLVLDPPRAELYARCDARLAIMVEQGALDEVRAVEARALDPALPALKAVGYREFAAHLRGETSLDQALDAARQETRRYAKRQLTWFRNQTPDWKRIVP
ncbi:tRNA (adenosine(37)-N6)-dimethylallyltransferase MiaA [Caulobacter vibrioides]|uniref:tRNA (adenosine(37)-N6)-dimethylallyltransferase MiaA n=1 Tax=Caulobacter vibrioides TaxID=155892 RepID=UPI000BB4EA39|nr:tRNA (adenosine(37)-N6)-dimethylallyltransferase MiaA [Caulobacter vibrioides]ATC26764.1 tRNA (adenosine(37)-N6)-dimethylallyltransferase MiaA [Caulobacter vibrioides]AZH13209.1 tRNA (adenosine(37)-N6)-dimethylallyltransferase MiaA [Caulobacter vibrioides]PLR09930.1 tRNA (adenosine(37)-N6)-dimethylallyltransferase MiaA [Caulobacter vibrioides]